MPSDTAFKRLSADPDVFDRYHAGFRKQAQQWPDNPLDTFISRLQKRTATATVADFGCGDARLALEAPARHTVHSFDLVSRNERVVACNIAHTPLVAASVDIAIFSLSLMGTDHFAFIWEAARVLRAGGALWVAEVGSRFDDRAAFIRTVESLGFRARRTEDRNFFVLFEFTRTGPRPDAMPRPPRGAVLKPCVYKAR
eukprot:gnl/Ergobibamus_cyprinoides/1944.p1 GENE.gnl/Ergobibamus_cyprinoides/1944~~gnl/Ergobibamus_cyprinoides/1944.p1  ORF type:complete len:198 (+),score=21.14 gnl/Ergobibamus_cyprinoides/1944:180-773(+)